MPVSVRFQDAPRAYDVRDQVELRRQLFALAAQMVTRDDIASLVESGGSGGVLILDGGTPSLGGAPYITDGGTP